MIAKSALRLLWSFLIIAETAACVGMGKFPVETLIEYDRVNNVCGEYRIVDYVNFKYEFVRDLPVCPSIFGFPPSDVPYVLRWMRDAQEFILNDCEK